MADSISTWTVTIIVIHDGVHDHVYDELEQSILQQELTGRLRYVFFYYYLHEGVFRVKELIFHNNFQRLETIAVFPAHLYDPQTFFHLFNQFVGQGPHPDPNHRHLVILNGHGAGLGFFADRHNDAGIRMLTAEQLATVFQQTIRKVDVLVAVSCYTQLLETGYCLKDTVELYVAPQTTMTYYGIHYAKLFALMEKEPALGLKEMAVNITGNFLSKYQPDASGGIALMQYADEQNPNIVAISANYLKEFEALVGCVNELSDLLFTSFDEGNEAFLMSVVRARRSCGELTPSRSFGFIDLSFFIEQLLKEAGPVPALQDIHQRFGKIRERCIASLHRPPGPPDLYAPVLRKSVHSTNSPLFLSIFFPAFSSTADQMAIRKIYFSEDGQLFRFRRDCRWERFIREFFNRT